MTSEPCISPRCGHDLVLEQRVKVGPLEHNPRGLTLWCARGVRLPASEHIILTTLVLARGAFVFAHILAERIGYDGDGNVVQVLISRLRRRLREAGAPATTVMNVTHRGYRLNVEMLETFPC